MVKGANSVSEAIKLLGEDAARFQAPVVGSEDFLRDDVEREGAWVRKKLPGILPPGCAWTCRERFVLLLERS